MGKGKSIVTVDESGTGLPQEHQHLHQRTFADNSLASSSVAHSAEPHVGFAQEEPVRYRNRGYSFRRAITSKHAPSLNCLSSEVSVAGNSSGQEAFPLGENPYIGLEKKGQANVSTLPSSGFAVEPVWPPMPERSNFFRDSFHSLRYTHPTVLLHKAQAYLVRIHPSLQKFFTLQHAAVTSTSSRQISLGQRTPLTNRSTGQPFIDNTIRSNKYTLWTFFPRQLLAQFSKMANLYFLCVSILQLIPGLSTTGTYTTIVPLAFFVGISMAKEGYEDMRRHRLDKVENFSTAVVLDMAFTRSRDTREERRFPSFETGTFPSSTKKWEDIQVGDVVQLSRNEQAPADLILLHSSNEDGTAYVETTALDGETNLKSKMVLPRLFQLASINQEPYKQLSQAPAGAMCEGVDQSMHESALQKEHAQFRQQSVQNIQQAKARLENNEASHMSENGCARAQSVFGFSSDVTVTVEDPNLDLYNFNGKVAVGEKSFPLTNAEVVYRGSVIRNTSRVLGLIVYSGEECKIRMNASRNVRIKAPRLQDAVNKVVLMIVAFVLSLAVGNTVAYQLWKPLERNSWYLADASVSALPIFVSFVIIFNTMIPLSLYVSLEIVKIFQTFLMQTDLDMFDGHSNTPMESRTTTINEELGQVKYVFSDKTGTLTNNSMHFRRMSVLGLALVHGLNLQQMYQNDEQNETLISSPHTRTQELLTYIQAHPDTGFAKAVGTFLLSIALCHTVIPELNADGSFDYQATSPDEVALLTAAKELGFMLTERRGQFVTIKRQFAGLAAESWEESYEILDVIEFSSDRKRMSVIVRTPGGRICLFCKGADSTITQLLRLSTLAGSKAQEVAKRAEVRKRIEAAEYARRSVDIASRPPSLSRSSFGIERLSLSSIGRPSFGIRRVVPSYIPLEEPLDIPTPSPHGKVSLHDAAWSSSSHPQVLKDFDDTSDGCTPQLGLIPSDDVVLAHCLQHVDQFATEGLRTLLYGHRSIRENEYRTWRNEYHEASTSMVDRQAKIEQVAEAIEHSLELTGASAIEDKLQDGVPETIDLLRRANIKIAMLTGDKSETAINIGRASNLILSHSHLTVLDHNASPSLTAVLTETIRTLSSTSRRVSHSAIVVDGATLSTITSSPALTSQFVHLFTDLTSTCICTRLSPSQKAQLVTLVRQSHPQATTLAIGDGSNDIAMIREAHIGIGITAAKEGLQAARTADYTIAQFRFLAKLLLVHGRWNYIRTCKYVLGTFWKEMLFYMTQAWWQIHCGWTGTSLYESWSLTVFNTLFTSLPVIFLGIFEQDYTKDVLLRYPELYRHGQQSRGFNIQIYLLWALTAIAESALLSFSIVALFAPTTQTTTTSSMLQSSSSDLYALGTLSFTACIILIATKLQFIEISTKTWTAALAIGLSIGGWGIWNVILASVYSNNSLYDVKNGLFEKWGKQFAWWLVLLLLVAEVWLFEFIILGVREWIRRRELKSRNIEEERD